MRSREGLVYSVSGGFAAGLDHPGTFVVSGQTSAPAKFVRAVTAVLDGVTREALPPAELQLAKDKALNSFVFNFASNAQQLSRIVAYDLFGIDQRYPFEYRDNVQVPIRLVLWSRRTPMASKPKPSTPSPVGDGRELCTGRGAAAPAPARAADRGGGRREYHRAGPRGAGRARAHGANGLSAPTLKVRGGADVFMRRTRSWTSTPASRYTVFTQRGAHSRREILSLKFWGCTHCTNSMQHVL